jgi:hypothetical protein
MKKNKIKQKGYDEKYLPIFQFFDEKYIKYDIDEMYYQCIYDDIIYNHKYYDHNYYDSDSDSDISHLYEYDDYMS